MPGVVGVLLAAGSARRFGADKRHQPLSDGMPMALASASRLRAACPRTLVVLRPGDEAFAPAFAELDCLPVLAQAAAEGMGHSLAAGVAAAADAAGWLIALADMPVIQAASYRCVLDALADGASLAQPTFCGQPGHPVGFAAHWFAQLVALCGDSGARQLVRQAAMARVLCPVDDPGVLLDIDTPADLINLGAG